MLIALIADVHANILALEAVLKSIRQKRPDKILSLGDQVNLGPCPRETLDLLKAENVHCLHGNHERYILSAMQGDPAYSGANFASLRYNASFLQEQDIRFEKTYQLDGITFCHALPEDDRFPVNDPSRALPLLREMRFDSPTHILCGHGHNPIHYQLPGLRLDGIGSLGCMDEGTSGTSTYTLLLLEGKEAVLMPYSVHYDVRPLRERFLSSGMAEFCPIMAQIICLQMTYNRDFLVGFVTLAGRIAASKGEASISPQTWQQADARFPWPDGIGTSAFWKRDAGGVTT